MQNKPFAHFNIGEDVTLVSKSGDILAVGLIESITAGKYQNKIMIGDYCYSFGSVRQDGYLFNTQEYETQIRQATLREYTDVVDKEVRYACKRLSEEQVAQCFVLLQKISAVVKPVALSRENKPHGLASFQKLWGNSVTSLSEIRRKVLRDSVFILSSYDSAMKRFKEKWAEKPNNIYFLSRAKKATPTDESAAL